MVKPWQFDSNIANTFATHARQHIPGYERVIDKCVSICCNQLDKNASIVDVGCAIGETLVALKQNGFVNLYGVDNSQDMLDKCPPVAELILSDNLPDIIYDAVLMNWTLHFIKDKREYLDSIYKNLRTGGFVIISDKTNNHAPYLSLYHEFKRNQSLTIDEINQKAKSLEGKMFINDQHWYHSALMGAGFSDISIIDADWCFTTYLAWKHHA